MCMAIMLKMRLWRSECATYLGQPGQKRNRIRGRQYLSSIAFCFATVKHALRCRCGAMRSKMRFHIAISWIKEKMFLGRFKAWINE